MTSPKEYYRTYTADNAWSKLSDRVLEAIKEFEPVHVLEFGSGSGKHLIELERQGISACGVDISLNNFLVSHFKNNNQFLILGDESHLRHLCNFDVVVTVSVLDHIEDIVGIVEEFKRIANKGVILAETCDEVGRYYYSHDYAALGFERLDFQWFSDQDGATYNIYLWIRPVPTVEVIESNAII